MEIAASRFESILTDQESEAVTALVNWRREELKSDIEYFHNNLELLSKLLMDYIEDMTSAVKPNNENAVMLVDRNDIWMNLKQIESNVGNAAPIVSDMVLIYYSDIDTIIPPLYISATMTAGEISAARAEHKQKLEEKKNREENYQKLESFCNGTASSAKRELESLYEQLEDIYQRNIVVYENTDDRYKNEARGVYDACTSFGEGAWDTIQKTAKFVRDVRMGAIDAALDLVRGTFQLAVFLGKVSAATQIGVFTEPLGITPKWVQQTRVEAEEALKTIGTIVNNPTRALASLGQQASDMVEEKGIINHSDEVADVAKNITNTAGNVVGGLDDMPGNAVDNIGKVLEVGSAVAKFYIDEIRPQLKTEPDTAFLGSGKTDGVGGAEVAADNIWENIELPRLMENPNVTKITIIVPKTGIETVIFQR